MFFEHYCFLLSLVVLCLCFSISLILIIISRFVALHTSSSLRSQHLLETQFIVLLLLKLRLATLRLVLDYRVLFFEAVLSLFSDSLVVTLVLRKYVCLHLLIFRTHVVFHFTIPLPLIVFVALLFQSELDHHRVSLILHVTCFRKLVGLSTRLIDLLEHPFFLLL